MKIGIITTQFANYGSRLQNLATVILLKEKYKDSTIETIVISTRFKKFKFVRKILNLNIFKKIYLKIKFHGKINKNNKILNYNVFFLKSDAIEEYEDIKNRYDLIVVGSDQIWNYTKENPNYKFAMFAKNKICNAPSYPIRAVSQEEIIRIRPYVESFKDLNFREQSTVDLFRSNGIKCQRLLDPVLQINPNCWETMKGITNLKKKVRYFVYILNDKKCFDDVVGKIKKTDKDKAIFLNNNGKDKFKYTPLEFLNFIRNCDCVITNSFHGACFAKIFSKNLVIINNKLGNKNDSRFDDFINYEKLTSL